jgi:hypothetical protein
MNRGSSPFATRIASLHATVHAVDHGVTGATEAIMRLVATPVFMVTILVGFAGTTGAQIPTINIDKTCRAAAGVTESLLGGDRTPEQDLKMCLDVEHKARDQIIKDLADLFIRRQEAVHSKRCLFAELRGMGDLS